MKLAIAGMSHVGLSNAILLAQHNEVVILDTDADAVDQINHQRCPIDDPELADYLSHKPLKLRATLDRREAYQDAHFVIIATPTDGEPKMNGLNTQTVEAVIQDVLAINPEALMVIMSTLPVGFTAWARQTYATDKLIFSPGFLREGKALHDQPYPSRMIVGERSERARRFAGLLQQSAIQQHIPTLFTDSAEAEAIKLLSNAYLAMRAAYFKALDNYAVTHGLDARQLIDGVCLDPRIGAHDLDHGGDCPPEDATQWLANDRDLSQLLHAIIETNAAAYDETRLKKSRAPLQSGDGDGLAQPNQEALGDEGNRAGNHSQQSLAPKSTGEDQAALPESRSGNQPPI
jgi:UDPglucose 6-dehydrogenase